MVAKPPDQRDIFRVALSIESEEARNEYLNQVCGANSELLNQVATLLRLHHEDPDFLESPPSGVAATMDFEPIMEDEPRLMDPALFT